MDIEQRIRREVGLYFIRRTERVYAQCPEIDERLVMAAAEVNRQRIREGVVSGRID
ncbi:hypothetical protein GOV03_03880, partial [Candidatus Woesearchaeota archaeon]|nr:hypothetical protein [Candidatus Woesearchaeota archaeon]